MKGQRGQMPCSKVVVRTGVSARTGQTEGRVVGLKCNPAPGWPLPYGFEPPPGWEPDPDWPPAPPDWPLWIGRDAPRATAPAGPPAGRASARGRRPPGRHAAGPHAVPPVNQAPVYAWKGQAMHRDVQPRPGTNGWAVAASSPGYGSWPLPRAVSTRLRSRPALEAPARAPEPAR